MEYIAIIVLQVLTGVGLLAHGIPKLLDLRSTMSWYARQGYGAIAGVFSTLAETVAAFMLIVGLFPRIAAAFIGVNMIGAMFHHWKQRDEFQHGWEPAYLYLVACIVIVLAGVGWI